MKVLCIILALITTLSANAKEEKAPTIDASAIYRTTVAAAKSIVVFEGLPHQLFEKELLAVEIQCKDTQRIWEYSFYTPSVAATKTDELRQLLGDSGSLAVYRGPELCGGTTQTTASHGKRTEPHTTPWCVSDATRSLSMTERRL